MKLLFIRFHLIFAVVLFLFGMPSSYAQVEQTSATIKWVQSSQGKIWDQSEILSNEVEEPDVVVTDGTLQIIDGFGVCFNELGWTALSILEEKERENILKELFDKEKGLRLNICRMPVGANDYSLNYYSLNDSSGDFEMKYFNIERDKKYLIPYIKSAMKYRPDIKIWGSPWTPPSWMKTNNHYACRPDVVNDMTTEQAGYEGKTMFRMTPDYLNAYALYFVKYIEAYRSEGINISGIHPQNEMNSCQNFPSCIWTSGDLGHFTGNYLGPAMEKSIPGVEIWYGTYERPVVENIDTILTNQLISKYISGISFQWAGKQAIPGIHKKYPHMKLMQSETECGDGSNDWKAGEYTFSLMKHYFDHGVSVYSFWNSILDETGKSMWGWKQNSMITIDSKSRQVTYNPEFYLLKHFSAFIEPGAQMLETTGETENLLAFRNPDGTTIIIIGNIQDGERKLSLQVRGTMLTAAVAPHTFNTFIVPDSETSQQFYTEDDFMKVAKIDVHCHVNTDRPDFMEAAIDNNFRILTINTDAYGGTSIDDQLAYGILQKKLFPDHIGFLGTFSMNYWNKKNWEAKTITRIKKSMKLGASGLKIWKNIGMVEKEENGEFIMIDNPRFDRIFDYLEDNAIPVIGHLGEPKNCWLPLDQMTVNNDRSYFEEHPHYHMYLHPDFPSYDQQINARNNMLRKHPELIFTGAHMGSL
jgi:glucosylceramidase